jgi:hypothetical protein
MIITASQRISPEMIVESFKKCVYSMPCMELMICCAMALNRMGMLEVSVRMIKTLTVKKETATVIGKGRYNLT